MSKPFDPTNPVKTRDGRKARILCTDTRLYGGETIVFLASLPQGKEEMLMAYEDGRCMRGRETNNDLVNIPMNCKGWVNIYNGGTTCVIHESRQSADRFSGESRINCIEIEWSEP